MRRWATLAALLWVASGTSSTLAAPTETGETGLVTIPTTEVLAPLKFSLGVSENGGIDSEQNQFHDIELHRTGFSLGVGLIDNLEFSAQIPYVQFERDVPGHKHTDDIGGLRLNLKYRLFNEADGAPFSFSLLGAAVIGTGRDSFPAILDRNSAWGRRETYEAMGILDKNLFEMPNSGTTTLTVNAGGLFYDKPESFSVRNQSRQFQRRFFGPNATFDDPFEFAVGLKVPVLVTKGLDIDWLNEWRGNTGTIDEVSGSLPTQLFEGVRLTSCSGLGVQGGVNFGLSGFLEPYRFIAALTYAMPAGKPAPAPVAQAAPPPPPPPPPPPLPVKKKIVLRGVHFDFDKATIRPDSMPVLREAANTLKDNPAIEVVVEGHTDGKGTEVYNQRLSLRRANAVRDYLTKLGVAATRTTVRGKGKSQPVASNDTDDGRAQNRRVELLVQP